MSYIGSEDAGNFQFVKIRASPGFPEHVESFRDQHPVALEHEEPYSRNARKLAARVRSRQGAGWESTGGPAILSDRKRIESQLLHWKILNVVRHEGEFVYQRNSGNRCVGDGDRGPFAPIVWL